MTDIERKMTMDEIKGLLNGISSISCATATAIDFNGVTDVESKIESISEYLKRIEDKTKCLNEQENDNSY